MIKRPSLRLSFFLLPFILILAACSSAKPEVLEAREAWGRSSPASTQNAAFYLTLENTMGTDDQLIGAEMAICDRVELHETTIDDQSVMRMGHIGQIDIAGGVTVRFEPGGLHLMCIGLKEELKVGEKIPIRLSFAKSDAIQVEAEIREP